MQNVRDVLLSKRRQDLASTLWKSLSEKQQSEEIDRLDSFAFDLVTAVVETIAQGDFPVIHAKLDSFKIKSGEVTITGKGLSDDEALIALNHIGTKAMKIVVANEGQFDLIRAPVEISPDQPDMLSPADEETEANEIIDPETGELLDEAPAEDSPEEAADQPAQYHGGRNSYAAGHKRDENPFNEGTDSYFHWDLGWADAADEDEQSHIDAEAEKEPEEPEQESEPASADSVIEGEAEEVDDEREPEPKPKAQAKKKPEPEKPADPNDPGPIPESLKRDKPKDEGSPSKIWKEGFAARNINQGPDENPFDGGTPEWQDWQDGYAKCDQDIWELVGEGAKAYKDGLAAARCPYKKHSDAAKRWLQGYTQAREDAAKEG